MEQITLDGVAMWAGTFCATGWLLLNGNGFRGSQQLGDINVGPIVGTGLYFAIAIVAHIVYG